MFVFSLAVIEITPCSIRGTSFTYTIVSRRSCLRAGTRYYMRGVDPEGHAANFVETEQIVETQMARASFVQVSCCCRCIDAASLTASLLQPSLVTDARIDSDAVVAISQLEVQARPRHLQPPRPARRIQETFPHASVLLQKECRHKPGKCLNNLYSFLSFFYISFYLFQCDQKGQEIGLVTNFNRNIQDMNHSDVRCVCKPCDRASVVDLSLHLPQCALLCMSGTSRSISTTNAARCDGTDSVCCSIKSTPIRLNTGEHQPASCPCNM